MMSEFENEKEISEGEIVDAKSTKTLVIFKTEEDRLDRRLL